MIEILESNNDVYYWNGIDEVPEDVINVVIEDGITEIKDRAFSWHRNLKIIKIPFGVIEIGNGAFESCSSLQSVVIPDSVKVIGDGAFEYCSSLQSVVIPDSVKVIGDRTFASCKSLESIVIPSSVEEIGWLAFLYCTELIDVKILGNPKIDKDAFRNSSVENKFKLNNTNKDINKDIIEVLKLAENCSDFTILDAYKEEYKDDEEFISIIEPIYKKLFGNKDMYILSSEDLDFSEYEDDIMALISNPDNYEGNRIDVPDSGGTECFMQTKYGNMWLQCADVLAIEAPKSTFNNLIKAVKSGELTYD